MSTWRAVVEEPEFSLRREAARQRLIARRRRADGYDTPLPDLPDGEIWVDADDDGLAIWVIRSDGRLRVGDITVGDHTAPQVWSRLLAFANTHALTGEAIFSTFLGDGVLAELPAASGAMRVATRMQRPTADATAPVVRTRPMTDAEYDAYRDVSADAYAEELRASGAASDLDAARAEAEQSHVRLLPQGLQTPGQKFWTIRTPEDDEAGLLWLHLQDAQAYIYDIEMRPAVRGQGYGTQALRFAAEQAREAGIDVLALNVFGHNDDARRLYTREGFVETEIVWSAPLSG